VQHEEKITSRVSPNGRFAAFMSDRSLTGYDNRDAVSGEADEELYEYDAQTGRLICVSCNPTGARPNGVFDPGGGVGALLVDRPGVWGGHWLAASISAWRRTEEELPVHQPRNLSDSGRLFFESADALVPQDTNGLEDVYEYEPLQGAEAPASDACASSSPVFHEQLNGCVSLISSGTGSSESVFYDASETGDDVFFATAAKLVGADYDNSVDVYDAHVCSSEAPCAAEQVSPLPCESEEACRGPQSAQPTIFGPTASSTFSGQGNITRASAPVAARPTPRALSRAQKLKRALAACRKQRRKRRMTCERSARRAYGASRTARAGKSATRGGKGGHR